MNRRLDIVMIAASLILPQLVVRAEPEPKPETKPFVEVEDLTEIVRAATWDYLKLTWIYHGGDVIREGPEIVIVPRKGHHSLIYRETTRKEEKRRDRELTKDQIVAFTKELADFMIMAKKEVDFMESLEGLSEREKQARQDKLMKDHNLYGIGFIAYSLELRQGGQSLTMGDCFETTQDMFEWMRSQRPKVVKKPTE